MIDILKNRLTISKGRRILLIDDDVDITITIKSGLEYYGFKVDTYNDPLLALSKFRSGIYGLILSDIRMPNMTGFELCEKIRKKDKYVKVCFVTAFEVYYEALLETYKDIDCNCFIKKPIQINDLVNRIKQELEEQ